MLDNKNHTLIIYALLCCVLMFISCSKEEPGAEELTVGITSFMGEAASFIAQKQGFFEKEGLHVRLKVNNSGSESIRQLLRGEIDIAHVAETPLMYALTDTNYYNGHNTSDLAVFANIMYANHIQSIVARTEAGIEKPKDVVGKRIGLVPFTQSEYHLDSFLLEHQLGFNQVDTVHLEVDELLQHFEDGKIDVVVIWEPHATRLMDHPDLKTTELPTKLTYSTLWLALSMRSLTANKPEVVKAYLQALKHAQQYIGNNEEEVIDLLAEKTKTSQSVVGKVIPHIDYGLTISERMMTLLDGQQNWLERQNRINRDSINIPGMIYTDAMETVNPEGVTVIR